MITVNRWCVECNLPSPDAYILPPPLPPEVYMYVLTQVKASFSRYIIIIRYWQEYFLLVPGLTRTKVNGPKDKSCALGKHQWLITHLLKKIPETATLYRLYTCTCMIYMHYVERFFVVIYLYWQLKCDCMTIITIIIFSKTKMWINLIKEMSSDIYEEVKTNWEIC